MELVVIWFISMVAIGEEIKANDAEIELLQLELAELQANVHQNNTTILKLAASHSAFYAKQSLINEQTANTIDMIVKDIVSHSHKHSHE